MYKKLYKQWLNSNVLSANEKAELISIADNLKEIEYRFGKTLEFGTAGMRGIIGLGTNMMNIYTVRLATQGLAEYIKSLGKIAMKNGVVISYDTRRFSFEFAYASALVLANNGIKTYLFKEVHPVPMLSFAVRQLNTQAGIMITASHNPKDYNGFKVYGEDGAQMSPEATAQVVSFINAICDPLSCKILCDKKFEKKIRPVSKRVDRKYYNTLSKLCLSPVEIETMKESIRLVYTPVHGSGYIPVTTMLKKIGIKPLVVPEQTTMDSEFSTVKVPNPEFKETLSLAIKMANIKKADVVFGTDPDCDRLGVAIRDDKGEFVALSGNQTGILLLDYVLRRLKEKKQLTGKEFVVKSFVTTSMAKLIANDYSVEMFEVPVGFKFIGEKIKELDDTKIKKFVFGFEESCGYLRGTHARDKDAVVASMLFAEMVCYYNAHQINLYEHLQSIYQKYGYVFDINESTFFEGLNAMKDMNAVVNKLKKINVESLGGVQVVATRDYSDNKRKLANGDIEELGIQKNNAIYYELECGGFVCVRPSGTEPKLKVYYSIKAENNKKAQALFKKIRADFNELIK